MKFFIPEPSTPSVVVFRGGPHDGAVRTDGDGQDESVAMARFLVFLYEQNGTAEATGNFNVDSQTAHHYKLASVEEIDGVRTLVVDYDSHHRG